MLHGARSFRQPNHHPDVPDIMVVFRDDLGAARRLLVGPARPHQTARLPALDCRGPATTRRIRRCGWSNGPFPAGARFDGGDVLDVGPTVLELLGLPFEGEIDGQSLTRFVTGVEAAPRDRRVGPRAASRF